MTDAVPSPLPPLATVDELNDLRQRVLAGEEFSSEEYSKIIQSYRANRLAAVTSSAVKTRAKAAATTKAAPQDLATLMNTLGL